VGYSTDIVAAVWVGYDDAIPLGPGESGAATALPAWIDFMGSVHKGKPSTRFPRPSSIIVERIDPATGLLARPDQQDALEEEFLDGTVPTEVAPEPIDEGVEDGNLPGDTSGLPEGVSAGSSSSNPEPSQSSDTPTRPNTPTRPAGSEPPAASTAAAPVEDPPPF
jgi:membrane carboxypeptidase/penicillin-binding protein